MAFPKLPSYRFSWRSIQVEPTQLSGERIAAAVIFKGDDDGLHVHELLSGSRLGKLYGREFAKRIADALALCVFHARKFYKANPISTPWSPPLRRFFLSDVFSSVAENGQEGLSRAAMQCSSFSVSTAIENLAPTTGERLSAPQLWRKRVFEAVTAGHAQFSTCFGKSISIPGSRGRLKLGFLSESYAAEFDVLGGVKNIRRSRVRVQSKLWQLDRLRDEQSLLIRPKICELLLEKPATNDGKESLELDRFLEELRYEAARRGLGLYATESPADAARHLIENAA